MLGLFLVPSLVFGDGPSPAAAARLAALRLLPTLGRSGRVRSGLQLPGLSFLLSSAESSGLALVRVRGPGFGFGFELDLGLGLGFGLELGLG